MSNNDHESPLDVENSKPKRVLTEVQRLAFLKGREKRMANIEKKRQEKIEQSEEIVAAAEPKPKAVRRRTVKSKKETTMETPIPVKPVEPPITPADDFESDNESVENYEALPEMPVLRRQTNKDQAEKIAEIILERIRKEEQEKASIQPPPAVKKSRKSSSVPRVAKKTRTVTRSRSQSEPVRPGEDDPYPMRIPERSFNWM